MKDCDCCNGHGVIIVDIVKLVNECNICKGSGVLPDWVDRALGRKVSDERVMFIQRNIQQLTYYLNNECYKMGLAAKIDFQPLNHEIKKIFEGDKNCII